MNAFSLYRGIHWLIVHNVTNKGIYFMSLKNTRLDIEEWYVMDEIPEDNTLVTEFNTIDLLKEIYPEEFI